MSNNRPKPPVSVALWIGFCAFCNCAGWVLSALHQLNAAGYAVTFLLGIAAMVLLRRRIFAGGFPRWNWRKLRRRFGRAFPMGFLILATLAILGGVLYPPNNYDGLTYRTPRVLHWLAEQCWHWIHTEFHRINVRGTGFEWVSAPVIALTKTDRFLFLINAISFLLLPGLLFSVFTRLGLRKRVAWHWMWLVPTAYCFLLQAGSVANDLFGAVFVLASVDFALRARGSHRAGDVWLSLLAAALMTGSKALNLALLLPWLVAVAPSLKLLRAKLIPTLAVGLAAGLVSFLPIAILNIQHGGDWAGIAAERIHEDTPLVRAPNNAVLLTIQNLAPPVFPFSGAWNKWMQRLMPGPWRARLEQAFEPGGAHWVIEEMQIEECAGLGLGVSGLLLASMAAGWAYSRRASGPLSGRPEAHRRLELSSKLIVFCAGISLLAFMAKSGLSAAARLATPFYPLCIAALLMAGDQMRVVRAVWWRRAGLLVFGLAGILVVLSPARPLWPATSILTNTDAGTHPLLARARTVYSVYRQRSDAFAPARSLLPPGLKVLGMITLDDPETSLWRPFGQRRIEHVTPADSPADLQRRGIQYVLASAVKFDMVFHRPFEQWLREVNGEIVATVSLPLRATLGPTDWFLVKLQGDHRQ